MTLIEDLIEKRKDLLKQLEAVDTVLKIYGHIGSDYIFNNNSADISSEINNSKVFPTKIRLDKQILWLFENSISKGLKLKEVQKIYNEQIGNDSINIDNRARLLKKEGKLVIVKYNGKHVHSFWGLPTWVEGDNFKSQYIPDEDSLPDVVSSEIVRE